MNSKIDYQTEWSMAEFSWDSNYHDSLLDYQGWLKAQGDTANEWFRQS